MQQHELRLECLKQALTYIANTPTVGILCMVNPITLANEFYTYVDSGELPRYDRNKMQ